MSLRGLLDAEQLFFPTNRAIVLSCYRTSTLPSLCTSLAQCYLVCKNYSEEKKYKAGISSSLSSSSIKLLDVALIVQLYEDLRKGQAVVSITLRIKSLICLLAVSDETAAADNARNLFPAIFPDATAEKNIARQSMNVSITCIIHFCQIEPILATIHTPLFLIESSNVLGTNWKKHTHSQSAPLFRYSCKLQMPLTDRYLHNWFWIIPSIRSVSFLFQSASCEPRVDTFHMSIC